MTTWLHEIALSEDAAAVRRTLAPSEFLQLQRAIEHLALVSRRPIAEIAERMMRGVRELEDGGDGTTFGRLIADVLDEHDHD